MAGTEAGSPRTMDFRLSAQRQKFEIITVTIDYKNGQLLRLRVILAPAGALDPTGTGHKERSSLDENAKKYACSQFHARSAGDLGEFLFCDIVSSGIIENFSLDFSNFPR